jgi:hypothetical protein
MPKTALHKGLTIFTALVWFINGFFCKVLNLVPRHELIVAKILGIEFAGWATKAIGVLEMFMALWIMSRFRPRLNAVTQIIIVATMNTLEFILVPDLLLWHKANAIFAFLFILIIYYNAFHLNKPSNPRHA